MYEAKNRPLLPRRAFYWRVARHVAAAGVVLLCSLALGMLGYMLTERMPAVDAFLNTAMLLGGMGQVTPLVTNAGKLFAGVFALYGGVVFVACATLIIAPVFHRVLHHFHVSDKG